MKKVLYGTVAAVAFAAPALAAGFEQPMAEPAIAPIAPAPVATGTDWTGGYVGAQLGYGDFDAEVADGDGVIGGLHAGYRWDLGTFVVGIEGDYDWADVELDGDADGDIDSVARLKVNGGYDAGRALIYGTLGAAYAEASVGGDDFEDTGIFGGVGVTYLVTDAITVGGEILYHQFDDFDDQDIDVDATTFTARVGYRF